MRATLILAALLFAAAASASDAPPPPANWFSGVGASELAEPRAAGEAAAAQAKAKLDGNPAKLVLVFAAQPQLTPELVEGVKAHFPGEIVHGSQVASPLSLLGNMPDAASIDVDVGVCVWALGGDVDVLTASARTDTEGDDVYYNAGVALGGQLKDAIEGSARPGRLVITFGDQYTGSNKDFASGLNDGFDKVWPIIGGASGNVTAKVIFKGEISTGINLGILLAGEFAIGQAMGEGSHTPEIAGETLARAIAQGDKEPFFALLFNCRRRRTGMMERGQLAEELEVMKKRLGNAEFFGFYGPGEIGANAPGEPVQGMGFTIVTAVFFAL